MVVVDNKLEWRKIAFELSMYDLDFNINTVLSDLEKSDDPMMVKMHFDRVTSLIREYDDLMQLSVDLNISFDRELMLKLAQLLFNKYVELVDVLNATSML